MRIRVPIHRDVTRAARGTETDGGGGDYRRHQVYIELSRCHYKTLECQNIIY